MILDAGEPHGAEENRIEPAELVEPIGRHHASGSRVSLATPIELVPLERETEADGGALEHALGGGNDLFSDSVARDDGDSVPPGRHDFGSLARSQRI